MCLLKLAISEMLLHPVFVASVNCRFSFLCGLQLYESVALDLKGTAGLITAKLLKQVLFSLTTCAELAYLNLNCDLENFIRAEMKTVDA